MTAWRVAKALETLRNQVNARWPGRSKSSDGTIGDTAHAARGSDHNPGPDGVVEGMDITHDPRSGCDAHALAEALKQSRDPRIKYIISNARICAGNAGPKAWQWRQYNGSNPHNKHMHLSVTPSGKDNTAPWAAVDVVGSGPVALLDDMGEDLSARSKPSLIRRIGNWLGGTGVGGGGLLGLGYLTDAQTVAILCVAVGVLLCAFIGLMFALFGVDGVRKWVRRWVG